MIVEMRTYTLKPLRTADFLNLYEQAALPLQLKYLGHLIGFYVSELRSSIYGALTAWLSAKAGALQWSRIRAGHLIARPCGISM